MSSGFRLVLGSNSPRRSALLSQMGYDFVVRPSHVDEDFPADTPPEKLPSLLSRRKANHISIEENEVLLTADTVVVKDGKIYNKPMNPEEAIAMLSAFSGATHEVITSFTIRTHSQICTQSDTTSVDFQTLREQDMACYVDHFQPFDLAGAYGIQDWIGMIGISSIRGSFYTVMGLPTHLVFPALEKVGIYPNIKS